MRRSRSSIHLRQQFRRPRPAGLAWAEVWSCRCVVATDLSGWFDWSRQDGKTGYPLPSSSILLGSVRDNAGIGTRWRAHPLRLPLARMQGYHRGCRSLGCKGITVAVGTGGGCQPAMVRACCRAFSLSVMPGKRWRSSIAADSSPSRSKTARIAAASASVTTNMAEGWGGATRRARRHPLLSGYGRNCPGANTRNTVTSPESSFLPVSGSTM
jgi:hypothetical protein